MRPAARIAALATVVALVAADTGRAAEEAREHEPLAVWIDADPAVGLPGKDVDDGLALIQAFRSPELAIRGVSVTFGNAPLDEGTRIAREAVTRFGPEGLGVHAGAAGPEDLGRETPAVRALAEALEREALVVFALGPATDVATLLRLRPDLAPRILEVIAVAGRRPAQRFATGETGGRPHRDFNFEKDPQAFRVLLESDVPLTLAPWELSSKVWFREREVKRLAAADEVGSWLAAPARAWLALWEERFGVDGFNPFDTLAIAYRVWPDRVQCETIEAEIQLLPSDTAEPVAGQPPPEKPYLIVAHDLSGGRELRYCHTPARRLGRAILDRIVAK